MHNCYIYTNLENSLCYCYTSVFIMTIIILNALWTCDSQLFSTSFTNYIFLLISFKSHNLFNLNYIQDFKKKLFFFKFLMCFLYERETECMRKTFEKRQEKKTRTALSSDKQRKQRPALEQTKPKPRNCSLALNSNQYRQ